MGFIVSRRHLGFLSFGKQTVRNIVFLDLQNTLDTSISITPTISQYQHAGWFSVDQYCQRVESLFRQITVL